ncbi:MAG: cation diffusion facilitator family transporter [Candidatus Aminicenantes bacterium]|nr:cation diffusion facilitator family transporter [Candidatus Aminicenantes bacterium]
MNTPAREMKRAAAISVAAGLCLGGLKLVVGLITGSLGILAEAAHSGLDLVAAAVTYLAVRLSVKPPDVDHPFGHGKIENFSALIETGLLFLTCGWIITESVRRLVYESGDVDPGLWGFLVMAVSIAVDVNRSRVLRRVARKHNSQALEADALHFSADIWSSSVVVLGLALVWLGRNVFPGAAPVLDKADAGAALAVAFLVLFVSYKLGKRTLDVLLDSAPAGLAQKFREAAGSVEGVMNVGRVRVRRSGPRIFVDIGLEVDRYLSVEGTETIVRAVKDAIELRSPGADVVVHVNPRGVEQENRAERIRGLALRNRMAVHNIHLAEEGGKVVVALHLEVDENLTLQQAHDMAGRFEQDLQREMPDLFRVDIHIESRDASTAEERDVTADEGPLVGLIRSTAERAAGRPCCRDITLRRQGERHSVSLECAFDRDLSILQVHDLTTRIEEELKRAVPSLARVLVHAEPDSS